MYEWCYIKGCGSRGGVDGVGDGVRLPLNTLGLVTRTQYEPNITQVEGGSYEQLHTRVLIRFLAGTKLAQFKL